MSLTGKHYGIILFALATAFLHLSLMPHYGAQGRPFDPIVLNGLGYLALLGAYFLPQKFFSRRHLATKFFGAFQFFFGDFLTCDDILDRHGEIVMQNRQTPLPSPLKGRC